MLHQRTCQRHGTSGASFSDVQTWHQFRATIDEVATARLGFTAESLDIYIKEHLFSRRHRGIPLPPSAVRKFEMLSDYLYRVCTYITHESTMSIYQHHPTSSWNVSYIRHPLPLPTHRAKAVERRATWYLGATEGCSLATWWSGSLKLNHLAMVALHQT